MKTDVYKRQVHNIPFATNIATAEALIRGVERGDFEWREKMCIRDRYGRLDFYAQYINI